MNVGAQRWMGEDMTAGMQELEQRREQMPRMPE